MSDNVQVLVFYHGGCNDGLAAAAILKGWYEWNTDEESPDYNIATVGVPPGFTSTFDQVDSETIVYLLDIMPDSESVQHLIRKTDAVIVYDHHQGTVAHHVLRGHSTRFILDTARCGAVITWDATFGGDRPEILEYIQDRDLWIKQLPSTDEVATALQSLPRTVEAFQHIIFGGSSINDLIAQGEAILEYKKVSIEGHLRNCFITIFEGYTAVVVNCTDWNLVSDLLARAMEHLDVSVGIAYFDKIVDNQYTRFVSLRCRNGILDVGKVARGFGGGGHSGASGYNFIPTSPDQIIP